MLPIVLLTGLPLAVAAIIAIWAAVFGLAQPRPIKARTPIAPRGLRVIEAIHVAGAVSYVAIGVNVISRVFNEGPHLAFGGLLFVDALACILIGVIVGLGLCAALSSIAYMRREIATGEAPANQLGLYYAGFHAFLGAMLLTCALNNVGLMLIAVEATTFVSALLVGFTRSRLAIEAAWKYLILCTVGMAIALLGVMFWYWSAYRLVGDAASLDWTHLASLAPRLEPTLVKFAFALTLFGLGTKAGFAPMHTWLPDAHSQAPSPISALLSGVLLNCAVFGALRFYALAFPSVGQWAGDLLIGFGLLSIVVATPFMFRQRELKRLLAYSSVEHIGLIAVAVGIGGPIGYYAGLLHLINHAVTKAMLFFAAGDLTQRFHDRRIARIRGAIDAAPLAGTLLLVGGFAITGVPPFSVFVSEFSIITASVARGDWWIAVVVSLLLVTIFAAFFQHVSAMAFGGRAKALSPAPPSLLGSIALLAPAIVVVWFGLQTPPALNFLLVDAATALNLVGR